MYYSGMKPQTILFEDSICLINLYFLFLFLFSFSYPLNIPTRKKNALFESFPFSLLVVLVDHLLREKKRVLQLRSSCNRLGTEIG